MAAPFIEIGSDDMAASRDFFEAAMGWAWTGEIGTGWFETSDGQVGLHEEAVPAMNVFFPVADLDATLATIRQAGGALLGEVIEEPGFGRFAQCVDPRGVRFGLHQKSQG